MWILILTPCVTNRNKYDKNYTRIYLNIKINSRIYSNIQIIAKLSRYIPVYPTQFISSASEKGEPLYTPRYNQVLWGTMMRHLHAGQVLHAPRHLPSEAQRVPGRESVLVRVPGLRAGYWVEATALFLIGLLLHNLGWIDNFFGPLGNSWIFKYLLYLLNLGTSWPFMYLLDLKVPLGNLGPLGTCWITWTFRYLFNTMELQVPFWYLGPLGICFIPLKFR